MFSGCLGRSQLVQVCQLYIKIDPVLYVCVLERERQSERKTEGKRDREREREIVRKRKRTKYRVVHK